MGEKKIILDLCGGTGAWSKPYQENNYDVKIITLPDYDLTEEKIVSYCISLNPYGILFACDCTVFANSGARWFKTRKPEQIYYYMKLLIKGLRIINNSTPKFWCIENPIGRMRDLLGDPKYIFNPCDHGDPYTKKTLLWGKFNIPKKQIVTPHEGSKMHMLPPSKNRKELRSITPKGFAKAFFEVNK